ncbi:DUF5009 domain-containing protein [Zhouia sp. PK063]|uniref:DUF5009 domain-containing protein n=1 Tax=Zhouia sp. PK063 TaxID=3373602 RepID=UPI00378FCAB8
MNNKTRILSIDIMRGLTLFLMLFVNDLYEPVVPKWLIHAKANEDGMGLADWVFPGFLFMVGMAIPFAFLSRQKKGDSNFQILIHTMVRTLSLLLIGIFMVNIHRLNPELTGISTYAWAIWVYISIFLIWNNYPSQNKYRTFFISLKILGWIGLVIAAYIFKAGTSTSPEWMITSWWGILGLIGWGYFAAAITYLITKKKIAYVVVIWLGFIALNIFSQLQMLNFLNPIKPVFGVLIDGNVPAITLCGLVVGMLLKSYKTDFKKLQIILIPFGVIVLILGFILRIWFIISKIQGTPSWAMLCNGISILVFCLLFFIIDQKLINKWTFIFKPAGQNSLTTYLAPDVIYYLIWSFGLPILFYKQDHSAILAIFGALIWAAVMIGFAALLSKIHIKLKL